MWRLVVFGYVTAFERCFCNDNFRIRMMAISATTVEIPGWMTSRLFLIWPCIYYAVFYNASSHKKATIALYENRLFLTFWERNIFSNKSECPPVSGRHSRRSSVWETVPHFRCRRGGEGAGRNYRGPAFWKEDWGPTMLRYVFVFVGSISYS
jgi:hypothetical protein